MTTEWIKAISVRNKYKDLNLIEKVIRANVSAGDAEIVWLPFLFQGRFGSDAYFGRICPSTIHRH